MRRQPIVLRAMLLGTILSVVAVSPAAAVSSTSYEQQLQDRVNTKRVERDRVALKSQSCVDRFAEQRASWLARHGRLEHQNLRVVLTECNLTGVAENIASGFSSGNKVVTAWMGSSGHRANLLRSTMRYSGVGAVRDDDGTWWVAQVYGTRK